MCAHARVIPGEAVSVNPENRCIPYREIITWLCFKMRVSRAHTRMRTWRLGSKNPLHLLQVALFVAMMRESAVAAIFGCVAAFCYTCCLAWYFKGNRGVVCSGFDCNICYSLLFVRALVIGTTVGWAVVFQYMSEITIGLIVIATIGVACVA